MRLWASDQSKYIPATWDKTLLDDRGHVDALTDTSRLVGYWKLNDTHSGERVAVNVVDSSLGDQLCYCIYRAAVIAFEC